MSEWAAVDYCIREEYEAKLNLKALDRLDPIIREGIDMDLLAKITHTDPDLLRKYKPANPPESRDHTPSVVMTPPMGVLSRSASLHRIGHDCVEKKLNQKLQETMKRNSLDGGNLRRVRTLSDVNTTTWSARSSMSSITMMSVRKDSGVRMGTTPCRSRIPK